ncbi:MAG: TIGR03936 family radical SAM-associated protein [Chloroflexota bacterium]
MDAPKKYKYRLIFSKGKQVKYVGHLDTVITWTRAFRRAKIPLAYSEGFNPQARIQVAISLPVGHMGKAELMDIFLKEPIQPGALFSTVNATLPRGFCLNSVAEIDPKSPSMQKHLIQANYNVLTETALDEAELTSRIESLLAAEEYMHSRIRRKKKEIFNLRPMVNQLHLRQVKDGDAQFNMRLSAGHKGNLRPESVLEVLGLQDNWFEIERAGLIFDI